jgi:hypothetical protein
MSDSTSAANTPSTTSPSSTYSPKIVRVAAAQLESVDFDLDANVAKACKYIALAAEPRLPTNRILRVIHSRLPILHLVSIALVNDHVQTNTNCIKGRRPLTLRA